MTEILNPQLYINKSNGKVLQMGLYKKTIDSRTISLFLKVLAVIFICEVIVMTTLHFFEVGSSWAIIADSILLTVLVVPLLYIIVNRRNINYIHVYWNLYFDHFVFKYVFWSMVYLFWPFCIQACILVHGPFFWPFCI